MSYSRPGKWSTDPRSGVLSANIEHGQGLISNSPWVSNFPVGQEVPAPAVSC